LYCSIIEKSGGVAEGHDVGFILYYRELHQVARRNIEKSRGVAEGHDVEFILYYRELHQVARRNIENLNNDCNELVVFFIFWKATIGFSYKYSYV
jgi:hypothetical protein